MKKQLYVSILLFILLFGCQTEKQEIEKPTMPAFNISLTQINFLSKESSQTVTVTSNSAWKASVSPSGTSSWLTISTTEGKAESEIIQITASANEEYDDRIASIKISTATTSQTINVNQKKQSAILLSKNKYEVNKAGEQIEVIVQSNINFKIDIPQEAKSWITPVQTKGLETHNLLFKVSSNSSYETRTGEIRISENEGGLSETVNVFQAPGDALILSKKETNISDLGGNIQVELKTNIDYDVLCPDKWIRKVNTKSIRTDKVTFFVEANNNHNNRKGVVIFRDKISYLADTLTIHQVQKDALILSEKEFNLSLKGGAITIEVQSNIPHTITIPNDSKSWIFNLSAKSLTAYTYSFSVSPNQTDDSRTGRIIVESENKVKSDTINIYQEGQGHIQKEYDALKILYQEMGGSKWLNKTNWLSTRPIEEWHGIQTNEDGFVCKINLFENNLSGKIPTAIAAFKYIEELNLGSWEDSKRNNLTGAIPMELWDLKTLKKLELGKNKLSGELPDKIENLVNLTNLNLEMNQFSGKIPDQIGKLILLTNLILRYNQFSGEIPESICNLSHLVWLYLDHNELTGKLSDNINNISQLDYLSISNNKLSGTIPSNLFNIEPLKSIYLENNTFSGEISSDIRKLKNLKYFMIQNNNFTGSIPSELGECIHLEFMRLDQNRFTGCVPANLMNLSSWSQLHPKENIFPQKNNIILSICDGPAISIPASIGLSLIAQTTEVDVTTNNNSWSCSVSEGNEWCSVKQTGNKLTISVKKSEISSRRSAKVKVEVAGMSKIMIVEQYPDFTLPDINYTNIKLSEIYCKNRFTILHFWGYWCPYSRAYTPTLTKLYKDYKAKGLEIMSIHGSASKSEWINYVQNNQMNWINLYNESDNVFDSYPAKSVPSIMIIDTQGKIVFNDNYGLADLYIRNQLDKPVVDIPMLDVSTPTLKFNAGSQTKNVIVTTNQPSWQFNLDNTTTWCSAIKDNNQLIISVNENTTNSSRNTNITVTAGSISKTINITQESLPKDENYVDSEIVKLLSATQGEGIDLIFMGDGFIKTDLQKGGNYEMSIKKAVDHYFSVEPYKSYRDYFNVYMIVAESNEKGVSGEFKGKVDNKFESTYGNGTAISCNDKICKRYISLIESLDPLKDLSVILVLNSYKYAGTCMFWSDGFSIAMCPMSNEMPPYDFKGIVCHEAGGHGFAKLADEYIYYDQQIPTNEIAECKQWQKWGAYQNIDFTGDLSKISWKDFIGIPKYDTVGAYEGSNYYKYGVWRPESNSCMNNNVPYYNAPSRWVIVKRIMQISQQELSFDMFVRTDRIDMQGQSYAKSKTQDKKMPPLSPPIYMK